MRITIIGVGAMGSLFAGRLSHLADITLLGNWKAQINILNTQGLTLIDPEGRTTRHSLKATNDPTRVPTADLILILVKSPNTAAAAKNAAVILGQDGLVITLQNGLGNLETIGSIVGSERVAQGVTSDGAAMLGTGIVRHAGAGQTYLAESVVGTQEFDESRSGRLQEVTELFNKAGFETQLVQKADSLVWGKLAVNAGINPVTALLQVRNGFLLENDDAHWLMGRAATEVSATAEALSIPLPYTDAAERAEQVARATAANYSSMAQDIARKVPTEIEAICGAVVQYGQQFSIPTPVNLALYELIHRQTMTGQWHDRIEEQPPDIRQRLARLATRK